MIDSSVAATLTSIMMLCIWSTWSLAVCFRRLPESLSTSTVFLWFIKWPSASSAAATLACHSLIFHCGWSVHFQPLCTHVKDHVQSSETKWPYSGWWFPLTSLFSGCYYMLLPVEWETSDLKDCKGATLWLLHVAHQQINSDSRPWNLFVTDCRL